MAIAIEHQESIAIAYVEKAIEGYLHKLPAIHENITENNIENINKTAYTIIRRQMAVCIIKEVIFHARNYKG